MFWCLFITWLQSSQSPFPTDHVATDCFYLPSNSAATGHESPCVLIRIPEGSAPPAASAKSAAKTATASSSSSKQTKKVSFIVVANSKKSHPLSGRECQLFLCARASSNLHGSDCRSPVFLCVCACVLPGSSRSSNYHCGPVSGGGGQGGGASA